MVGHGNKWILITVGVIRPFSFPTLRLFLSLKIYGTIYNISYDSRCNKISSWFKENIIDFWLC